MDVRHLELMRELSARGTLAAVAAATHRTPSALSQQLRAAERDLGLALVEPDRRGVRLTWAGRVLADGADDVLAAIAQVQSRLDAGRGEAVGVVRIGTLPSAGAALMPGLLARLEGGGVEVILEDFDVEEVDFARRALDSDLVIAHSLSADVPAGAEGLFSTVVAREPVDVAVPAGHRLAAREELTPEDVAGERWISVPAGYPFATVLASVEAATGATLTRVLTVKDNRLVEALVGRGTGLALLPRFSTPPSAHYRLVPLTGVRATRAIAAIGHRDRVERLAVRVVIDALIASGLDLEASAPMPVDV